MPVQDSLCCSLQPKLMAGDIFISHCYYTIIYNLTLFKSYVGKNTILYFSQVSTQNIAKNLFCDGQQHQLCGLVV